MALQSDEEAVSTASDGLDAVDRVIESHRGKPGGLIAILQGVQHHFSYLSEPALRRVAEKTGRSLVDLYGIASFYRSFSLKPRGEHLISVCLGTACHVRGAPMVAEEFERQLGIRAGETTEDRQFTLETVNCLGACALGPIVVVDGHYHAKVGTAQVSKIIQQARGRDVGLTADPDAFTFPVDVSCPRCNHRLMHPGHQLDGQPVIWVTAAFGGRHGWVRLSSLYGSQNIQSQYEIPPDTIVQFFCPHCHAELRSSTDCADCGAPMIAMIVRGGGVMRICSRHGCRAHMLDLSGVNA